MGSSSSKPTEPAPPQPPPPPSSEQDYYDRIDRLAAELPNVIDEQSRQQVQDYQQACNNGRGPMVACFATAEYLSLFERRHAAAADLYDNVCFRPHSDTSPNGVTLENTKSYPAGCFNLGKMYMTGKGVPVDRIRAYHLVDRSCRGGHGGACYLQAQLVAAPKGTIHPDIPHDIALAQRLYQHTCDTGDSLSCYTLATMLLRGNNNETTTEAVRPGTKGKGRDPRRAEKLLRQACDQGGHVTSCHNLAVMYTHGDDGIAADAERADHYKKLTQSRIDLFGGSL